MIGSDEDLDKQPKQGCKAPYEAREQAATTTPTLITRITTGLSAAMRCLLQGVMNLTFAFVILWLWQFIILSLLGIY